MATSKEGLVEETKLFYGLMKAMNFSGNSRVLNAVLQLFLEVSKRALVALYVFCSCEEEGIGGLGVLEEVGERRTLPACDTGLLRAQSMSWNGVCATTDQCYHACGSIGHGQANNMTDAIKVFEDMHKAGK